MDFFHSLAFGLIALAIVGGSWCICGLVMGSAPKRGVSSAAVQRISAVISCLVSAIVLLVTQTGISDIGAKAVFWTCASYFAAAVVNTCMLQVMSMAMQRGPNGIIWCIIQSAMLFPFLAGVLFFQVQAGWLQGLGVGMLLAALILFGLGKDNTVCAENQKSGVLGWKTLAFLAFLITGLQQNLATMPSYFEASRHVSSVLRTLCTSIGTLLTTIVWSFFKGEPCPFFFSRDTLRNRYFWGYAIAMQGFGLLAAYFLLYPGLDILAENGLGGMGYPLMVGSCIVSFTLASIFLLRERFQWKQAVAVVLCLAGLVALCWKG